LVYREKRGTNKYIGLIWGTLPSFFNREEGGAKKGKSSPAVSKVSSTNMEKKRETQQQQYGEGRRCVSLMEEGGGGGKEEKNVLEDEKGTARMKKMPIPKRIGWGGNDVPLWGGGKTIRGWSYSEGMVCRAG